MAIKLVAAGRDKQAPVANWRKTADGLLTFSFRRNRAPCRLVQPLLAAKAWNGLSRSVLISCTDRVSSSIKQHDLKEKYHQKAPDLRARIWLLSFASASSRTTWNSPEQIKWRSHKIKPVWKNWRSRIGFHKDKVSKLHKKNSTEQRLLEAVWYQQKVLNSRSLKWRKN